MRIAVIDKEKCKPNKCALECIKFCPVNRSGKNCVYLGEDDRPFRAVIEESLCIGCGICERKCPFGAIKIVNLPKELDEKPIHRFGRNQFALYRLPIPEKGKVIGLLGSNGLGKSTALKLLARKIDPNLGEEKEAGLEEISKMFRGTELQEYFGEERRISFKRQQVDKIFKGKVSDNLRDERGVLNDVMKKLGVEHTLDRDVKNLSGGELQRVAIASTVCKEADIYYFDEPSSYLDVRQRLEAGKLIRELSQEKTVMVVEHDLAAMDFLADRIHIFYGEPGVFGVVSKPYSVRVGINAFLEGYIKEDNVRIRDEPVKFEASSPPKERERETLVEFTEMEKKLGDFNLKIESGKIGEEELLGIFGANALGKTTFAKILAGVYKPDKGEIDKDIKISYKPQYLGTESDKTVIELLNTVVDNPYSKEYNENILKPLGLDKLLENKVDNLSGGELQRLAIGVCLSRKADLYLFDEPSAYLDVDQRLSVSKTISKAMGDSSAIIIDHDLLFLGQISQKGMVFTGTPGKEGHALKPQDLKESFNIFLSEVGVSFRRDGETGRPRANKLGSVKDREQKEKGEYYYAE